MVDLLNYLLLQRIKHMHKYFQNEGLRLEKTESKTLRLVDKILFLIYFFEELVRETVRMLCPLVVLKVIC